jgi:hypothetical protein
MLHSKKSLRVQLGVGSLPDAMLAQDLLTPASPFTPVTPSSSTALNKGQVEMSNPPTPTSSTFGVGVLVEIHAGELGVKTCRKILRIEKQATDPKGKGQELLAGEEVEFRTDGSKAFDVRRLSA